MKDIEERITKIVHGIAHRTANIYSIIKKSADEVDKELKKILLDSQEIENLKGMKGKIGDLK